MWSRRARETADARFRGEHERPSPLPGPGVFATADSVATPALLPDGSVAPESLSRIIESTTREQLVAELSSAGVHRTADARALRSADAEGANPSGSSGKEGGA